MAAENELAPSAVTRSPGVLRALVIELRPKQWIKNLACFAALIFSGQLFVVRDDIAAALAFATFCAASSAVYILNDILDRDRDRLNPRTASRPLASGALPLPLGVGAMIVLAALAIGGAALLDGWFSIPGLFAAGADRLKVVEVGRPVAPCLLVLSSYAVLNILYSLRLKNTVIADVMCISIGFVLRLVYGASAVNVASTAWSVLCMFFLALFLGFAKRKAELALPGAAENPRTIRPVLTKYTGNFLDILMAMSATMTIACYGLFTVAPERNPTLIITIVPVVYCVMRYMLQVLVMGRGESPEKILFTDRMLWAGVIAWVILCVAVLYGNLQFFAKPLPIEPPRAAARH